MSNISTFIGSSGGGAGSGGGSAGSGGSIPETIIFTTSGIWNIPQSVIDQVDSEGHAELGLLMVGSGNSTRSGEVVNDLFRLTSDDYDGTDITTTGSAASASTSITFDDPTGLDDGDLNGRQFTIDEITYTVSSSTSTTITFTPGLSAQVDDDTEINVHPSTPQISVVVGAGGGDSGITSRPNPTETTTQNGDSTGPFYSALVSATDYTILQISGNPEVDENGWPLITYLRLYTRSSSQNVQWRATGGLGTGTHVGFSYNGSVQPTQGSTGTILTPGTVGDKFNWTTASPFDGVLSFGGVVNNPSYVQGELLDVEISYDRASKSFVMNAGSRTGIDYRFDQSHPPVLTYNNAGISQRIAKGGGNSADVDTYRNNVTNTGISGEFGGFSRWDGGYYGSGGDNPQGGYVQIFYT